MNEIGVLFVCLGNYCRSPWAQGLFEAKVASRGLTSRFSIGSAGITGDHLGKTPDPKVVHITRLAGADISANRARRVTASDVTHSRHVIALERAVRDHLVSIAPDSRQHVRLLREFEPSLDDLDVPDPGGLSDDAYRRTHAIIDRATSGLLDHLLEEHPVLKVGLFARELYRAVAEGLESVELRRIEEALALLRCAREEGRRVFAFGNGGSAATAMHFVADLNGMASRGPKKFKATSLSANVSMLTAIANDHSYSQVFAAQLGNLAAAGDVAVAISASGESQNVVDALHLAREMGLRSIGLLGFDGGRARALVDVPLWLRRTDYASVESGHSVLCHLLASFLAPRGA
jgi:D-sedoheptulose 7-phosphate isomerase